MHQNTKRGYLFIYLIVLISIGLVSRKFNIYLPSFVEKYIGDLIWAWMVFIGFCWVFPSKSMLLKNILWALIFSYGIEFSQMYQAGWICDLRKNAFAKLVLGQGFLFSDLICYSIGIFFGFFIQQKLWKYKTTNDQSIVKNSK